MAGDEKRLTESITRLDRRDLYEADESQTFTRERLTEWWQSRPSAAREHDQEHPMTSPTQRRHDELRDLLTEIRDRLPEPEPEEAFIEYLDGFNLRHWKGRPYGGAHVTGIYCPCAPGKVPHEPVDEEPPARRVNVTITDVFAVPDEYGFLRINVGPETAVIDQNASNVTVTDVDTTPDVDPDDTEAYLTGKRTPDQTEQLAARVLDMEADVERLTRERDDLRARVDDLIRERGQAIERYKALREDVTAHALHHAHDQSSLAFDCFATTLEDDDKRGRDA